MIHNLPPLTDWSAPAAEKSSIASTPNNTTPTEPSTVPRVIDDPSTSVLSSSPFFTRASSVDSPPFASSSTSSPTKTRLSVSTGAMVPYGPAVAPGPFGRASTNSPSPTRSSFPSFPRRTSLPPAPLSFSADRAGGTKRRRAPAPGTMDFRQLFGSSPFGSPGAGSGDKQPVTEEAAPVEAVESEEAEKPKRPPRPVPTPSLVALNGISTPAQGWFAPSASTSSTSSPAVVPPSTAAPAATAKPPIIGFRDFGEHSVWSSCSSGTATAATELPSPFAASSSIASLFPSLHSLAASHDGFEDPLSPSAVPGAPRLGTRTRSRAGSSGSATAENSPGATFSPLPPTPGTASPIVRTSSPVDYFALRSRGHQSPLTSRRALPSAGPSATATTPGLLKAPKLGGGDAFSPLPVTPGVAVSLAVPEMAERPKLLKSQFSHSDVSVPRTSTSSSSSSSTPAEVEEDHEGDEAEGERDAGDGWTKADAARKRILLEWEARRSSSDTPSPSDAGSIGAPSVSTASTTPEKPFPPSRAAALTHRTPSPEMKRSKSATAAVMFKTPGSSSSSDAFPASGFSSTPSPDSSLSATPASSHLATPGSPTKSAGNNVKLSPLKTTDLYVPSSSSKLSPSAAATRPGLSRSLSSPGGALGHAVAAGLPASPTAVFASSPLASRVMTTRVAGLSAASALSDTEEEDSSDDDEDEDDEEGDKVVKPAAAPTMARSVSGGSFVSPLRRTVSRRSTFTAAAAIARRTAANREVFLGLGRKPSDEGSSPMEVDAESEDESKMLDVVNAGNGVVQVAGTSIQCGLFAPTAIAIAASSTSAASSASRRRRAKGLKGRSSSRQRSSPSGTASSSSSSTLSIVHAGMEELRRQPDLPDLPMHSAGSNVGEATKAAFGGPAGVEGAYTPPPLVPLGEASAGARQDGRRFNPYFPVIG